MKFHKLKIENFLSISHAEVQLADRGLQLIQGVNENDSSASSNGSGKSSLADAICWCLYGVTARGVKGDEVVNRAAKTECKVLLVIEAGSTYYFVARHRKHSTGKNSLTVYSQPSSDPGEIPLDISKGTDAETQRMLEKILGCSYDVFVAAVYSGQEAMPDLPRMKDRALKTMIEEASGLQRIEAAYEKSRILANALKSSIDVFDSRLVNLALDLSSAVSTVNDAEYASSEWEASRKVRVEESKVNHIAELHKHTALEKQSDLLIASNTKAMARMAEIDLSLAAHRKIEQAATVAEAEVRRVELSIDKGNLVRLMDAIKVIDAKIANAASEVKKPCAECGTVLETMSVEDYVTHQTKHLDAAKVKLNTAKAVARAQVAALTVAKEVAAVARGAVPDVSALNTERLTAQREAHAWRVATELTKAAAESVKFCESQVALRRSEPNPKLSGVTLAQRQLDSTEEKIRFAKDAEKVARAEWVVAAAVVKVFGPAGVRAQILDAVTPFLNERTADYLSALSDGEITATWTTLTKSATGELKEKFSIDVTHAKGGDSFAALSGGEKRKVRLASALALQDLVASRASQPINLWIGDEIDDALDKAGLERLMTILERRARERGTVLIISHSDLKDWCDNVTTVRKSGLWKSTIEGSLCI